LIVTGQSGVVSEIFLKIIPAISVPVWTSPISVFVARYVNDGMK